MVDEMKMRQRDAAGQNNLTREDFLQCDVACSAFSRLGAPTVVYKARLPTCHSHSGSLSTAAREAPPHQTKW